MSQATTQLLKGLELGTESAATSLWNQYFDRLVRLARRKLGGSDRRMSDEEDVALNAFHSFCRSAAAGCFARLHDGDDLWRLLATITSREAIAHRRYTYRQKRGCGRVFDESAFMANDEPLDSAGFHQVAGSSATPAFVAEMNDQCDWLLDQLHDGSLRAIAVMKLEKYSNQEIAEKLGYNVRTIEKKLARIRQKWQRHVTAEAAA